MHRRLSNAAGEWGSSGRDPSFLLSGSRLDQFEAWGPARASHSDSRSAGTSWQASRAARTNARRRRPPRSRADARAPVTQAAAFAGRGLRHRSPRCSIAHDHRQEAERPSRAGVAHRDRARARRCLGGQRRCRRRASILLAIQAIRTTRDSDGTILPEAEEALHRAVVASRVVLTVPGLGGSLDWSPRGVFRDGGPGGLGPDRHQG